MSTPTPVLAVNLTADALKTCLTSLPEPTKAKPVWSLGQVARALGLTALHDWDALEVDKRQLTGYQRALAQASKAARRDLTVNILVETADLTTDASSVLIPACLQLFAPSLSARVFARTDIKSAGELRREAFIKAEREEARRLAKIDAKYKKRRAR